jgi:polyhydroxyalkanoate synthase
MIKKMAKVIGFVGGVAAVVWAMRDRFVSVATSREPEPPTFRTGSTADSVTVDAVDGIGPVFAQRLTSEGLGTVAALAKASPDVVAETAGVSSSRARSWIDQAQQQD